MLSDEEIREHGFHQLPVLADAVPQLLHHDPALVLDIYRAAFSWRDDSDQSTPLRTGVLALSSNRRQDYDGARRQLADVFGEVVAADPAAAVAALKSAIAGYLQRREIHTGDARPLRLGAQQLEVQADHSAMWDTDRRVVDAEPQMLAAWQATLAADSDNAEAVPATLAGLAAESPLPAALISRLLLAGSQAPEGLGAVLADGLDAAEVLAAADTLVAYGELLRALWPRLDAEQRDAVEQALLGLPERMSPDRPEIGERRRDRLVALLDPESLVSGDAHELATRLRAAGAPTENPPLVRIEAGWGPVDGDDILRSQGIDPDRTDNRRALELAHALRDWHQARHQADTPDRPLPELLDGAARTAGRAARAARLHRAGPPSYSSKSTGIWPKAGWNSPSS